MFYSVISEEMYCSYDRTFKLMPMTHKEDNENNNVIQTFSVAEIYVRCGGYRKNNYRISVLHEKHHDNPNDDDNKKKKECFPSVIKKT
jgi:hypothetical protein